MKEKVNQFLVVLKNFLKKLSMVTIVAVTAASAFFVGYYYERMKNSVKKEKSEWSNVKASNETSVAVNERGELMIINRTSGNYQVYQDSVGKMIFDIYASKLYYKSVAK
jgi:hypothetical protein